MYEMKLRDANGNGYDTIATVHDLEDCYKVSTKGQITLYLNKDDCVEENNLILYTSEYLTIHLYHVAHIDYYS